IADSGQLHVRPEQRLCRRRNSMHHTSGTVRRRLLPVGWHVHADYTGELQFDVRLALQRKRRGVLGRGMRWAVLPKPWIVPDALGEPVWRDVRGGLWRQWNGMYAGRLRRKVLFARLVMPDDFTESVCRNFRRGVLRKWHNLRRELHGCAGEYAPGGH